MFKYLLIPLLTLVISSQAFSVFNTYPKDIIDSQRPYGIIQGLPKEIMIEILQFQPNAWCPLRAASTEMRDFLKEGPKKVKIKKSAQDQNLIFLNKLTNTASINLEGCNITDAILKYLSNAKNINLRGCTGITDDGLKHLTKVTSLNLEGCNITDDGLKHLTKVTYLNLKDCKSVTGNGLKHLNATTLNLEGCNITDDDLKHLTKVTDLNLGLHPGTDQKHPFTPLKSMIINDLFFKK